MRHCVLIAAATLAACGPPPKGGAGDDVDGGGSTDSAACTASSVMASEVTRPVDILWVIDNSGSMSEEEQRVQDNMNQFATSIGGSGVDYHVIVVTDTNSVNVPPPLGGSPRYLGVNISIGSNDPLEKLVTTYPMYQSFLRPSSVKHIVAVTDDESDWSRSTFEQQLSALTTPGFGTDWRVHAVVAEDPPFALGSHCFALSAAVGTTYLDLQQAHNGTFFSLCSTNWSPLFATLSQSVQQGISLPCTFAVPTPPMGQSLDPMKVNFVFTPTGGVPETIHNVGSIAGCTPAGGWYYDNPSMPAQIITCPATCSELEADDTGTVNVEYGCSTLIF